MITIRRLIAVSLLLCVCAGAAEPTSEELNRIAGTPLFGDTELWQERPSAVVWRLNVNCRAEDSGGIKMYAARVARLVFGCQASEIRIFSADDKVTRVDVFLGNKGDSALGKKRRSDIRNELRRSGAELEKLFRRHFGKPQKQYFGSGELRRQLPAWVCGSYTFLMDYSEGEYLIVRIVPAAADAGKRRVEEAPATSRKELAANVRRLDNGDVFIDGIPMVDQGRKGYCVPATVERVLRYLGIEGADMHKLAEKYQTGVGGSTRSDVMVRNSRQLFGDWGLKMREAGGLRRHTVVRSVDKGIPVLWFHYSNPEFKRRLDISLNTRRQATPEGWKKVLAEQKRVRRKNENAHVALLIGYNRDTDEFAVSNSWGDRYRIAWVRYADMEQVDAKMDLFVVVPKK